MSTLLSSLSTKSRCGNTLLQFIFQMSLSINSAPLWRLSPKLSHFVVYLPNFPEGQFGVTLLSIFAPLCQFEAYLLGFTAEMTSSSLASKFLLGWNLDRPCWLHSKLYATLQFAFLILHGGNSEPLSLCRSEVYLPNFNEF